MTRQTNVRKRFPELYDKAKNGKIKVWKIWVETYPMFDDALIRWESGYKDGEMTLHHKEITTGKNIGKANETTCYQQAVKEAEAKWQKKVDKGMVEDESKIGNIVNYFPMLAKTAYSPTSPDVVIGKEKITTLPSTVLLQPKLNGVRCTVVKKKNIVKLYSRLAKDYTKVLLTLSKHLKIYMNENAIWDGELYVHGWNFKRIIEAVKQDKSTKWRKKIRYYIKKRQWDDVHWWMETRNDTQLIQFHRYDLPSSNKSNEKRAEDMKYLPTTPFIFQVETLKYKGTWENIKFRHDYWVKAGYEGIIIRNPDAMYMWNHRDKCLLKYKEFIDEEFEIVGYKEGTGSHKGAVCWTCRGRSADGRDIYFDCNPRGELGSRRRMFKRAKTYIGKMLTVRYQERSVDGVPIFPVGIGVRDYE